MSVKDIRTEITTAQMIGRLRTELEAAGLNSEDAHEVVMTYVRGRCEDPIVLASAIEAAV